MATRLHPFDHKDNINDDLFLVTESKTTRSSTAMKASKSGIVVDYISNSMLLDCLSTHANFDKPNSYLPILGWFNDEHYKLDDINMCFTYMCKLSCNTSPWYISCANYLDFHLISYANYSCIKTLIVQQQREVKMDDL